MTAEDDMKTDTNGAILVRGKPSSIVSRGIERLQLAGRVDIIHDRMAHDPLLSGYEWVLPLGPGEAEASGAPTGGSSQDEDGDDWSVDVECGRPARIVVQAQTDRGRLYGLYHVAECLESRKPIEAWPADRRPLVPHRYAWVSGGNCWSPIERPDWFDRDIVDLPGLGINGVFLTCTPTHGTSIGRQTIPFTLTEEGIEVDRFKLPAFMDMFDRLKSYGLEIGLFHEAFIPAAYELEQVRAYYDGKMTIPGFDAAVERSSRDLATAMFTHLPQIDCLLFHSIECDWFWGKAVSIFPCEDDEVGERVFEAYLKGLTTACNEFGKALLFWTHVSNVAARQIRLMHRVLARYPSVVVVEDHAYQNNNWPNTDVMAHIAEDIRESVVRGRFGLAIDTTDGEYYGAGRLPTAYPDPHIRAGRTATELGAEYSFVRLNEQTLVPYRTLDSINAIHVITTAEQWWEPARSVERLWSEWAERRYGQAAAPAVVSALKKSEDIITKGLCSGRMPLMDHSGLMPTSWQAGVVGRAWDLFARPGELLVDKPYDELVGAELRAWQMSIRGVEMADFLQASADAETAAREALREIEGVQADLEPKHAESLRTIFRDSLLIIEAFRTVAVAARTSAVWMHEHSAVSEHALEEACDDIEALADRLEREQGADFHATHHFIATIYQGEQHAGYGVPLGMLSVAERYRKDIEASKSAGAQGAS